MRARKPYISILYNSQDITLDVSQYLDRFNYTDNQSGKADEINLSFDDSEGLWSNQWYPTKGDQLEVEFGYQDLNVSAGFFTIDEVTISGLPRKITIKGTAATTSKPLRSKTSYAHEDKTLKQIAEFIAAKNGLQVIGDIEQITIQRATQNRETDLGFLYRISKEYGYIFSVRADKLIFTNVYDLEDGEAVQTLNIEKLSSYNMTDKFAGTIVKSNAKYLNPDSGELIEADSPKEEGSISGTASDEGIVRTKAETVKQAEAKARAQAYFANRIGQTGRISAEGNPLFLSGNNIRLEGIGALDGKYQITSSTHTIDSQGGYKSSMEVKRVGL